MSITQSTDIAEDFPPLRGHPDHQHFCGKPECGTNIPGKTDPFCGHRGPYVPIGDEVSMKCMRLDGHDGNHAAYVLSVNEPQSWAS